MNVFKNMGFFQLIKLLIQYGALVMAIIKVLEVAHDTILPEWEKIRSKNVEPLKD